MKKKTNKDPIVAQPKGYSRGRVAVQLNLYRDGGWEVVYDGASQSPSIPFAVAEIEKFVPRLLTKCEQRFA